MGDIKDFKDNFALPDALELNPGKKLSHYNSQNYSQPVKQRQSKQKSTLPRRVPECAKYR